MIAIGFLIAGVGLRLVVDSKNFKDRFFGLLVLCIGIAVAKYL